MKTNLQYVGRIYKNCGPTGAQQEALAADRNFRKMATDEYGKVIGTMKDIFGQIQQQVGSIAAAGVGQHGWTPAETSARQGQVITQAAVANKQLQAAIAEKGAMVSGGGPGLQLGATLATEAGAEAQVLNKEAEQLQQNIAEDYATGRENYWKATAVEGAIPGEEAKISAEAAQPVLGSQKSEADQANENAAASSSWMGLVGGLASGAMGMVGGLCVTEDTRIELASGERLFAKDLEVGEYLRSMGDREEVAALEHGTEYCVWVTLENNMSVEVSLSHTLALGNGGYTEACEAMGKEIKTVNGESKVVSVASSGFKPVIRIRLSGSHTYVSNGIWSLE